MHKNIIAVDAMTCEYGIEEVVKGSISASENDDISIILVGDKEKLKPIVDGYSTDSYIIEYLDIGRKAKNKKTKKENRGIAEKFRKEVYNNRISILDAKETIGMDEEPSLVRTRKDSSIVRSIYLLKQGIADAVVSAGNSGASAAAAYIYIGRIDSLKRNYHIIRVKHPRTKVLILCEIPSLLGSESSAIADVGANPDCSEHNIAQYALLVKSYLEVFKGIDNPQIAQLTIGEEDYKGSKRDKEAHRLLTRLDEIGAIRYLGNKEPYDLLYGSGDGYICDAKTGNIFLKTAEAFCKIMPKKKKENAADEKPGLALDGCEKYGGSVCLGINKTVVITHGKSDAATMQNSISLADRYAKVIEKVNERSNHLVEEYIPKLSLWYSLLHRK